jgi:hypothetical protein
MLQGYVLSAEELAAVEELGRLVDRTTSSLTWSLLCMLLYMLQGDVLSPEEWAAVEELGILVDQDDQGVLMQIFTKPLGDR